MKKTFKEITKNIDMVLFNNIINIDDELELEAGRDYYLYSELYSQEHFESDKKDGEISEDISLSDESDEFIDIYQYFAINYQDGRYLSKITGMPLYYSSKCDLFILGVDFLDNWENLSYEL